MRPGSVSPQDGVSLPLSNGARGFVSFARPKSMIFDVAGVRQHHVLRLEVAVHDAARVGLGEALGHLQRELEGALGGQGRAGDDRGERPAAHQLHRDERGAVRLVDLVDDRDRRVHERRGGAGLHAQPALLLAAGRHRRPQHLQGDLAAEARVEGAVDDPHASAAELVEDPVVRERAPDHAEVRGHSRPERPGARRPRPAFRRLPASRRGSSHRKLWTEETPWTRSRTPKGASGSAGPTSRASRRGS